MKVTNQPSEGKGSHRSGRRKRSTSAKSSPLRKNGKDYSIFIGIGLVVFGLVMCLYSFDMLHNPSTLFDIPDINNMMQLWPIIVVILGFVFVLKDYFNKSKSQKWN
jgi:O-antigen/teichoic acid export membrane protein